jgi:hypothetical protein
MFVPCAHVFVPCAHNILSSSSGVDEHNAQSSPENRDPSIDEHKQKETLRKKGNFVL